MTPGWIGFLCGLIVGLACGIVVMSLCIVSKRSDEDMEQMFAGVVPPEPLKNTLPPRLPR